VRRLKLFAGTDTKQAPHSDESIGEACLYIMKPIANHEARGYSVAALDLCYHLHFCESRILPSAVTCVEKVSQSEDIGSKTQVIGLAIAANEGEEPARA